MRIKTQLLISILTFSIILIIIGSSVAITQIQITELNNQSVLTNEIQTGASDLNYISNNYFLYQDNSYITLWQTKFLTLSSEIAKLNSTNTQQQILVNTVTRDLESLNNVFAGVTTFLSNAPRNVSVRILPDFQTQWNRMAVRIQALSFDSQQLSQNIQDQTNQAILSNTIFTVALLSIFGVFFITIYFIAYQRTTRSIIKLKNGIGIIGSGNLDYTIDAGKKDEIADISSTVNQMATNLKTVTSSKTELEQAQISLRESEQRWATTLASIGDAVIATNTSGRITFMNGEAEELTGWTLNDASDKPVKMVFNIINEQTRLEVKNPIEEVLKEGMVCGLANHTLLIRKDGSEVAIDDSGAPIRDKYGKITGVVLVFRDITERKKTEAALRKASEQTESDRNRLEAILETFPSAVVIMDASNGKISYTNKRALQLYGFDTVGLDLDEHVSKVKAKRADGTDYPLEELPVSRALRLGQVVHNAEMTILRSDGQFFPVTVSAAPLRDAKGNITAAIAVFEDITERKKTEEALKENEQLYHTVFDNSQDGFQLIELIYDKNGKPIDHKFLKVNHAYETIIGVKADDILEKTARHISPNVEPHWLDVPDRVAKTGISEHVELYNKDIGKWLDCFYFLYSKNVVGTLFRDITARKKLEKQLQDSERLAAIGATAGMVGHDIRNPLQAITGDLYLAKTELSALPENEIKANTLDSLDEIEKNIDYINKIVADLQDYARPLNPRAQEANIKSLFNEILAKNGVPKNIKVTVEVEGKAERIMADPDYLKRIAANLTLNAVQAMPEGGKLTIHAYADKVTNDILITVKDTGVGIPEDIKPKLFTPMMTTKSKGQGFGLAVVKRMTEGLGGTVTFESTEGKGTTFIVRLPPQRVKR
jgi:PAS domain S-box-containing protein